MFMIFCEDGMFNCFTIEQAQAIVEQHAGKVRDVYYNGIRLNVALIAQVGE
jgi:hypothetical protein